MKFDSKKFADFLLAIRKKHGWSLRALEEKSGISNAYLSQLERNLRCPTMKTLWRMAELYGYTPWDFLKESMESKKTSEIGFKPGVAENIISGLPKSDRDKVFEYAKLLHWKNKKETV